MPNRLPERSSKRLWGILVRKERWGLSWRGRVTLAVVVGAAGWGLVLAAHPFLAVTHREDARVLVVEGWVHQFTIDAAVTEFKTGHYERVFTTGGPVVGSVGYTNDYNTSAGVGADLLRKAGVPDESLQVVPSHVMGRDRTYASALALRKWLLGRHVPVRGVNIVTEDVHARRTRLLFQKALGNEVVVGIISVPSPDYDAIRWWRYSEGVRDVFGESIAYVYARFFFHPSREDQNKS